MTIVCIHAKPAARDPFEYFCMHCGDMRLSLAARDKCGRCGAPITFRGYPGELDLQRLKKVFAATSRLRSTK